MGVLPLIFVRSVLIMVTLTYIYSCESCSSVYFFPHPRQHLFFCFLDNSFLKRSDMALKEDLDTAFAKQANSLFGLPWQPIANESWTFKPPFCIHLWLFLWIKPQREIIVFNFSFGVTLHSYSHTHREQQNCHMHACHESNYLWSSSYVIE